MNASTRRPRRRGTSALEDLDDGLAGTIDALLLATGHAIGGERHAPVRMPVRSDGRTPAGGAVGRHRPAPGRRHNVLSGAPLMAVNRERIALTEQERAERRQREQQLNEQAVAQLRSRAGQQRWLTVRARVGLPRYSVLITGRGVVDCRGVLDGDMSSTTPASHETAHARNVVTGQAGASASCMEAANASGPCSAAAGSIHMTCQPWPSRSKKLREYMKP
jgi:hypothetical protein